MGSSTPAPHPGFVFVCSGAVITVAAGLASVWAFGLWSALPLQTLLQLPSPGTTVLLAAVHAAILGLALRPHSKRTRALAAVAAVAAAGAGGLALAATVVRLPNTLLAVGGAWMVPGLPGSVGLMSAHSGWTFVLVGCTFGGLLLGTTSSRALLARHLAHGGAAVVAISGLVGLMAFGAGVPALNSPSAPMPASTAVLFLATSAALTAIVGRESWLIRSIRNRSTRREDRVLAGTALAMLAVAVAAGYLLLKRETLALRTEQRQALSTIADAKSAEVEHWRLERLEHGRTIARNPVLGRLASALQADPREGAESDSRAALREWLTSLTGGVFYTWGGVVSAEGRLFLEAPTSDARCPMLETLAADDRTGRGEPYLMLSNDSGLPEPDTFHLVVPLPVSSGAPSTNPGVLVLHVNARPHLIEPLLRWPVPSASGEVLVARRTGDGLEPVLSTRSGPLARHGDLGRFVPRFGAGGVTLSSERVYEGVDHRGVFVVAVPRRVPGTVWVLVAKVDASEAYRESFGLLRGVGTALTATVALLFLGFGMIRRSRDAQQLLRDMDERERELERERNYRSLVASLPDVVMRFDRAGRHLFVSPNVQQVAGLPYTVFLGKTHRELGFAEKDCRFWEETILGVFESGEAFCTEFSFDGPHGPVTLDWRLLPERSAEGVATVLSVSRDITAQRKAEQDYRTLFAEMLDGFALHEIVCDDQGRPVDYRFLAVNPAFERLTGLDAASLIGRLVTEAVPGTEPHWIETYGRVALTGEPVMFENYAQTLDRHFHVTAYRPAPGQFACIFADVTERKRAEAQVRQHVDELQRWYNVMLGREERIQDLKNEVNAVLAKYGEPPRYAVPGDAAREEDRP